MDVDESDKDISDNDENDSDDEEEHSSGEGSEEESDDESEDGAEALSDEEDEEGEGEAVSDDDGSEAASVGSGDEVGAVDSDSNDEALDKEDLSISTLDDPDMSCSICMNEFAGQDLGSPENCSHTFCLECIVEWSKNVNTCPIDRIEFHLIHMKQEISGNVIKKIKVKVKKEEEDYVEEVTLCEVCHLGDREDRLLLCDSCDSGYHCECLDPPLETIPIEEWFCPPCAQVINQRASGSHSSHNRLIARTRASEIVRSRIQNHRTANSEDSGPEAVQQTHNVRPSRRSPKKRKTTKRKTKRKKTRKTSKSKTTKARTKATTATGKSKAKESTGKRLKRRKRKTKKRKTRNAKKISRRSWLASMKLVAPSIKKRIADRLGLCKPPPGHTMPFVKKPSGQHTISVEQLSSLDMFGCRDQLLDFGESYADNLDNPRPSTSKCTNKPRNPRKPIAVASASGINLLDNILENQNVLLQKSKNITIGKDGSLNVKENLPVKAKFQIKSSTSETKNKASLLEHNQIITSSSMPVKKEKNVMPQTSSFGTELKDTAAGVSVADVNREKCSPSADLPSSCTKSMKLDDLPSLSSVPLFHVKKAREHLQPHVWFNDVETTFTVKDGKNSNMNVQQAGETSLLSTLADKIGYLPCTSSSRSEKEDFLPAESLVNVKEEKLDDLPLDSVVDIKSAQASLSATSLFSQSQPLKHSTASNLSVLKTAQKRDFYDVMNNSSINTNSHSFPFSITNGVFPSSKLSSKNHSQESSKPIYTKTGKDNASLYDKAENDRKRHLPFLSNGVTRPFKIPKLVKGSDGHSVSEANLLSSEISDRCLDTKIPIKLENVIGNNLSMKPMLMNGSIQCDLKSQSIHKKQTLIECTDSLGEAMGIDMHPDLNKAFESGIVTSDVVGNSSLHEFKQKMLNELDENLGKNSESSLLTMPSPGNVHAAGNNDIYECTVNTVFGFQNLTGQINSVSLNSNHKHLDKKLHDYFASTPCKAVSVKNGEQKHFLDLDGVEQGQNHKTADKPTTQINREHKALDETKEKVVSKHKLKESIVVEIRKHLKDFYVTDLITKDEYKEIMRRSVPKVLQNCGNSIDSEKIRKLVVSYVHLIGNTKSGCS